jgi:hypothetical protein
VITNNNNNNNGVKSSSVSTMSRLRAHPIDLGSFLSRSKKTYFSPPPNVQTGSGSHLDPYSVGYRGAFLMDENFT